MNSTPNGNSVSSKNKKRGRFNIIDLILIIVSLVLVAVIVYVFSPISWISNMMQKESKTIDYIVEFTNVDRSFEKSISEGETVIDAVSKSNIGKVSNFELNGYVEYDWVAESEVLDEDAQIAGEEPKISYKPVAIDYPEKCNLVVTITVSANHTAEKGYYIDSTRIAVGEKMSLRFPGFVGEGYCIGITENKVI